MTQDLSLNIGANTSGAQGAMVQLTTLTQSEMKKIASYVKASNAELQNTAKYAKDAANSAPYEQMAAGANKVASAHAGVNRELLVLAHEMSQGNFSRFGGSLLVLAERTNAMELALTGAGAAVLATAGALVGFVALVAQGAIETDRFNKSLIETNNYAGLTADSLGAMAHQVAQATGGTVGNARSALEALTASGKFGAGTINAGAQAVVQMERVTGQSADEIVKDFARMSDGVAKWAVEHNQSFHYLTATQYEYIKQLEDQGHAEQAEVENLKLLTAQFGQVNESLGYGAQLWRAIKQAASDYADQVKSIGRPQTVGDQIDALDKQIARMKQARDNPDPTLLNTRGDAPPSANNIANLEEQRRTLQRQQAGQEAAAAAKAQAGADQQAGIAARQAVDDILKKAKATSALTEALTKYRAEVAAAAKAGDPYKPADIAAGEAQIRKEFTPHSEIAGQNQYASLTNEIKAYNAATLEETGQTAKLTEAQKFSSEMHLKLAEDAKNLTLAQQRSIAVLIDQAAASRATADQLVKDSEARIAAAKKEADNQIEASQRHQAGVDALTGAGNDQANNILRQTSLIGKTADEATKLQELQKFDDLVGKALLGAEDGSQVAQINAIASAIRGNLVSAIDAQQQAQNGTFSGGVDKAMKDYVANSKKSAEQGAKVFNDAVGGMTDAITKFAETGKLSFSGLFATIADDLIRLTVQKGFASLFGDGASFSGLLGSLFGTGGSGAAAAGAGDAATGGAGAGFDAVATFAANGINYVPYDGFPAILHEGERVTSRQDAAVQRSGGGAVHFDFSGATYNNGDGVSRSDVATAVQRGNAQVMANISRRMKTGKMTA